jgi:hypothetical protein
VAPAALLVAGLLYLPFLWTVYLSFTNYDGLSPATWAGLGNYRQLLHDPALVTSIRNTLIWVVGTTLLPVGLGLLVAVLSYNIKGGAWLRLPFLLPYAFSGAGVGMVWSVLLSHGGTINHVLGSLHLPGASASFLTEAPLNTIMLIVAMTWQQIGVNTLLFVVGLQSIPREPVEAARRSLRVVPVPPRDLATARPADYRGGGAGTGGQPEDLRRGLGGHAGRSRPVFGDARGDHVPGHVRGRPVRVRLGGRGHAHRRHGRRVRHLPAAADGQAGGARWLG